MREVLTIHVGQAGVGMGSACWDVISREHGVTPDEGPLSSDDNFHTMFDSVRDGERYAPRALFIDSDASSIDSLRRTTVGKMMSDSQMIAGSEDASGLYSAGYCVCGPDLLDSAIESIRKLTERCSSLQGFLFQHAVSGGTGSALTNKLMSRLVSEYPRSSLQTISLFPEPSREASVVESYNTIFAAKELRELSKVSQLYDNGALRRLERERVGIAEAEYSNLNQIVAQAFSALTASTRYDGALNVSMAEIEANLIPYPTINFVLQNLSPLLPANRPYHRSITTAEVTSCLFKEETCMASCNVLKGYFLACCLCYRGHVIPKDVGAAVATMKTNRLVNFVDWCPTGFKCGINYENGASGTDLEIPVRSVMMLSNSTAVKVVFESALDRFKALFNRKAFVHWFTKFGIEEGEFTEASGGIEGLLLDYQEIEQPSKEESDSQ